GSELKPLKGKQIHVYASPVDARAKKNEITDNIYEVVGYTSNIKTGVGRVTVRGLGDYGSTRMLTFRIVKPGY
nr:hypothetical protein [Lachnospiraceae bacterium]